MEMLAVQEYLGALMWALLLAGVPAGISSAGANVTVPLQLKDAAQQQPRGSLDKTGILTLTS